MTAAQQGIETGSAAGGEAFEIAQWAAHSAAAAAVQQMSARFASANDALAALVRQSQDLSAFWRGREQALVEALAKPTDQRQEQTIESLRTEIASTEEKLANLARELESGFPAYASLAHPTPLKIVDIQQLLR